VFVGRRLRPDEYVICADEKSQLQALGRKHSTVSAGPGRPALVEFEYERGGTLAYLAAWDVHDANPFDRVEPKTGIEPFVANDCRRAPERRLSQLGLRTRRPRGSSDHRVRDPRSRERPPLAHLQ
jgi:hypothetical protein